MLTLMLFETSSFFFLQRARVLLQTKTLIKTLSFFTSRPLSIYILNNDNAIFQATILNYKYKCTKIKGFKVQEKHWNTIWLPSLEWHFLTAMFSLSWSTPHYVLRCASVSSRTLRLWRTDSEINRKQIICFVSLAVISSIQQSYIAWYHFLT